jgi:hypothetical protein
VLALTAKLKNIRTSEDGFASAALSIVIVPLVVAMIGFSFDFARIAYIKNDLEGNANLAVQSASNIGYLDNGRIVMGRPGDSNYSAEQAVAIYCANATHNSNCGSITSARVVGSPLSDSDLCSPVAGGQSYGLRLQATETIETIFLRIVGVPEFVLDIESTALVRPGTC